MSARVSVPKIVGINAGFVVLVLVTAELIFGTWLVPRQFGIHNLPRDDIRYFDTRTIYEGGGVITYTRDHNGLRGPYESPAHIDILAMGGSTTNERYVAEERTWVGVLRQRFAQAGRPLTVVNAGVEGHTTMGHIRSFDHWFARIPGLKPRLVIVYVGLNDMVLVKADYRGMLRAPTARQTVRDFMLNNSALYHAYRVVRGWYRAQRAELAHAFALPAGAVWAEAQPPLRPEDHAAEHRDDLAAYEERLRTLVQRIHDFGARPALVTQPRGDYRIREGRLLLPRHDEANTRRNYIRIVLFNDVTMQVCREAGAICIDLAAQAEFGAGDHYDRVHTTPTGSQKIGEFLFRALQPLI